MWRLEDEVIKSVFPSHLQIVFRNLTQVSGLMRQAPLPSVSTRARFSIRTLELFFSPQNHAFEACQSEQGKSLLS